MCAGDGDVQPLKMGIKITVAAVASATAIVCVAGVCIGVVMITFGFVKMIGIDRF